MATIPLTATSALNRYQGPRKILINAAVPLFSGVCAIFRHGSLAGLGKAVYTRRQMLSVY